MTQRGQQGYSSKILEQLTRLLMLAGQDDGELLPTARWLVVGSQVAAHALEETLPSQDDLRAILRRFKRRLPELEPFLRHLMESRQLGRALLLELQLEALTTRKGWRHPSEVLPKAPLGELLSLAKTRLATTIDKDKRRHLEEIIDRLSRAHKLQRRAARRRDRAQKPEGSP